MNAELMEDAIGCKCNAAVNLNYELVTSHAIRLLFKLAKTILVYPDESTQQSYGRSASTRVKMVPTHTAFKN